MNAVNMPGFAAEVSIYKQVERIPARNNSCLQSNEKQEVISQICIGNEEKDLRYFIAYGLFMTTRTAGSAGLAYTVSIAELPFKNRL